ncbi:MAG: MFS transporter, partial [Planctomycetota bacterium]|nr:MFS transporter [Planctomycetota bacterium]
MDRQHKHPLRGLLVAQFFGAFNDSAWKLLVAGLAIRTLEAVLEGKPLEETETQKQFTIAFVVITLPLMIFSIPAGVLADRVSKRTVIFSMKVAEVLLMAAGTVMLWVSPAGGHGLLWILGLMGMQSAIFSPAKYGILPEVLPHDRLSAGNGLLELCTFVAIIAGTVVGPGLLYTVDELHLSTWIAGVVLTVLAVVGLVAATYVPRVPAARSEGGLGLTLRRAWGVLRADRVLRLSVLGQVFFWVIASCLGVVVLTYAKTDLKLDLLMGLPLAAFAIGIGAGSVLAGKLSHAKVEYGLIPLGALGLFVFTLLFGVIAPDETGTYVLMALMGVSSGFVVVPLNALLQWRSPVDRRGAVIALANVFVFAGILVGTLGAQWLANLGLHSREIFVATSLVVFVGTVWALWLLPDAFLRFVLVILTHTFYRLKVVGRDNVPQEGGVLLVPNHVSFVDGLFLMGSIDRPIRFLVESTYFHHPFLKPFMKALRAIPLSASGGARVILRALKDAGKHLDEGHVVCIFAEGQISRTGLLLPFRRGLERIVKGRSAPIVPVFLDRVWGSIFSWQGGRFLTKIPQRIPYRVTVAIGEPQPAGSSISDVRRAVLELGERSWSLRRSDRAPLHFSFVRGARRRPFSFAYADQQRPHVRRYQALAGAVALARALRSHWKDQQNVGILLPATVAGGLVNLAAALSGRTSVNLNFTAGRSGMEAAARQAELRTVVTSRAFLEKAKVELPEGIETIWIEDVGASIGVFQRLAGLALGFLTPCRVLERLCGARRATGIDDVVTVIFSSGSTG